MSALKISKDVIEEVDTILSFCPDPEYSKYDVDCVLYALRSQERAMEWLRYRARLFENPNIVTKTESILDAIKKKKEIKYT